MKSKCPNCGHEAGVVGEVIDDDPNVYCGKCGILFDSQKNKLKSPSKRSKKSKLKLITREQYESSNSQRSEL